jgi:hypothetical protein
MDDRQKDTGLYRATVEMCIPSDGEWVITAEAVDTLDGLAEWASVGVGLGASSSYSGVDDFCAPSTGWADPFNDLVTDERGSWFLETLALLRRMGSVIGVSRMKTCRPGWKLLLILG